MYLQEIRHPEELSLCKRLDYNHLKFNYSQTKRAEEKRRRVTLGSMPSRGQSPGLNSTSIGQDLDRIIVDRPDTNTFISQGQIEYFIKNESFIGHYMVILWSSGGPQRLEGPL